MCWDQEAIPTFRFRRNWLSQFSISRYKNSTQFTWLKLSRIEMLIHRYFQKHTSFWIKSWVLWIKSREQNAVFNLLQWIPLAIGSPETFCPSSGTRKLKTLVFVCQLVTKSNYAFTVLLRIITTTITLSTGRYCISLGNVLSIQSSYIKQQHLLAELGKCSSLLNKLSSLMQALN